MISSDQHTDIDLELSSLLSTLNDTMRLLEQIKKDQKPELWNKIYEIGQMLDRIHPNENDDYGSVPGSILNKVDKGEFPDNYIRDLLNQAQDIIDQSNIRKKHLNKYAECINQLIKLNFTEEEIQEANQLIRENP